MASIGRLRVASSERIWAARRRPSKLLAAALTITRSTGPRAASSAFSASVSTTGRCSMASSAQTRWAWRSLSSTIRMRPAGAAEARGGAGDHAHAAAGGLALAQLVDHRLQAGQAAHPGEQHDVVDRLGQEVVGARPPGRPRGRRGRRARSPAPPGYGGSRGRPSAGGRRRSRPCRASSRPAGRCRASRRRPWPAPVGPSRGGQHLVVFGRELGLEQADVGLDVVDDQDPRGHAAQPSSRRMVSRKCDTEIGLEM